MIYFSFFISIIATIGSLYFSEVKGFVPCNLCWYQRILMYPIPLLIVISIIKDDRNIKYYFRFLSLIGIFVSSYHNFIQINQQHSSFCGVTSNCLNVYGKYFGFLTIPLMSLIAFLLLFIISFLIKDKVSYIESKDKVV
ncbi:disulfide bond formation protein B [Bacillus pseudomycoides]